MNPISLLFIALGALTVLFVGYWVRAIIRSKTDVRFPTPLELGVGFVVNFFDTLGIGMYAPTTSIFKLKRMVDDRLIPGTLNVGSSLTGVLQTFIIVALIAVDARTLLLMIAAATIGAWLGAGVV
ncbi:MAG TPA: permease, partial [Gemmatimonadaceae bacterium]|nr:permease [Gemmatimonadaceae bacterium]